MDNKNVFISYKAEEIAEATWVRSVLETNGISCWMAPACIPGGSSYASEIPQAIRGCSVFVLILSQKAQDSKWVSREVDLAINEGKTIPPFMLENCPLKDEFNFYLTNVQRYAAYESKSAAIEKMVREIWAMLHINPTAMAAEAPAAPAEPAAPAAPVAPAAPATVPTAPVAAPAAPAAPAPASPVSVLPERTKLDILALVSVILGALAVFTLGLTFVLEIAALVLAFLGPKRQQEKLLRGRGLSIAGAVLGSIAVAIVLLGFLMGPGLIIAAVILAPVWFFFVKTLKKYR
ncbi:MAG: TIR domain-containing protein [Oscillospiraceae bacterium]|nr:TIR domain-containing protein [Oscillospiraceae bacterium]